MGIELDYFAATSPEIEAMDLDLGPAGSDWPYVYCKGWILEVEEYVAEISGRDLSEFGEDQPLFDPTDASYEGPWTVRINAPLVDALTGITPTQIHEYADHVLLEDWEAQRLVDLAALARSARADGRDLYSWSSL